MSNMDVIPYEEEAIKFLNEGNFFPRYKYWAAMSHWEPEEALALTIDLEPSAMGETKFPVNVKKYLSFKIRAVREPIQRQWLGHYVTPVDFVNWAEKNYIDFPIKLAELIYPLDPMRRSLKEKLSLNPIEKSFGTRERETLLKLVIGMAISGYSYNPKASKNSAVSEIAGDLEGLGICVSDDTVRKWLNEAAQLLPQEALESP